MRIAACPDGFRLLLVCLAAWAAMWGQPCSSAPQIGYAYPAGGQRGTTFLVEVGGQSLRGTDGVRISGDGVRASVLEYVRGLDNQELRRTGQFLRDLVRRRWSARVMEDAAKKADGPDLPDHPWLRGLDEKSASELERLRTRLFDPKRQPNAQIGEQVVLEVTVAPDATPGDRELRLVSPDGLSNPLCFQVGMLRELREKDFTGGAAGRVVDTPVLLNGQITPGEVDRIRLRGRAGQQLVVRLHARRLIPYLADAVPGWFQATMGLYAPDGEELAWSDDYRFDPDPVLLFQVPADGVYELEVRDAIYRGRDDFVYRIAVGELSFVTQVFPLGGRQGVPIAASVRGWNLRAETLELDTRPGPGAIRQAVVGTGQGFRSEVRYAANDLPEAVEREPNGRPGTAQQVVSPIVVNGRIDRPGDVDMFQFEGEAGQAIVAEVYARRLNSPLDSVLRLIDPAGAEIALNDDRKDPEMGLLTHQADSYIRTELPRAGMYRVCLSDAQRQGGGAYAYRLQIRPAQPDFALRLVPSAINVLPGRTTKVTVHALRKDGFEGDVSVVLADTMDGFTLRNARIPAGEDKVEATIQAPRGAARQVLALEATGQAEIDGVTVSRPVVGAEDMMQAFLWRFLVPRQELLVAVTGSRPVPVVWRPLMSGARVASEAPVRIPLGGTAQILVEAPSVLPGPGQTALASVLFRLGNRPRGVMLRDTTVTPTGVALTLKADPNTAMTGDAANVIVEAFAAPMADGQAGQSTGRANRVSLGVLPAIPYEVVPP